MKLKGFQIHKNLIKKKQMILKTHSQNLRFHTVKLEIKQKKYQ